ncbi:transport permease protein [Actinoplanes ianthinogenes]|uniref:Transport permease protein n=1 Tax=Actinoplanes ianthinogenes TaxID=122358 RepID=A0ABM7M597_9ACTN|nr:ABC transporter permease [Actinoplanes ianthinogenes]BCJ46809.1 transport permease protein [Actinoplanes ianthinogenes]GGR15388.1 transport permease protein [Actinoplanes ianthinogenes]
MNDAMTMVRRTVRHTARNPSAIIMTVGMPVVLLLLFVGVFGGALSAGMSEDAYIDYLVAGVLLMTVGYGSTTTALAVNRDMTQGIINRFRTMAISRASVLTGHVIGSTVRTLLSAALVVAVAVALGFRPAGDPVRWLAAAGVIALLTVAMTWIGVAVGLAAKTAEGTAPFTLITQLLPFLSSAFVRPETMSGAVRWFAAHEPFTPIIDSLRGLLLGTAIGGNGLVAVTWCLVLAAGGYLWARLLFRRDPAQ